MAKISVIICTRNRAVQLQTTLRRLLGTDIARHDAEVVLVDSASTDHTPAVMAEFKSQAGLSVITVALEKPGLGRARNGGIQRSTGELLVFTDDDCYPHTSYFEQLTAGFDSRRYQYGTGSILLYDAADDPRVANLRVTAPLELPAHTLLPAGVVQGANMFFLRAVFDRAGLFDEMLGAGTAFPCEDIEMATRASLAGFLGIQLPQPVVYHHHGSKAGSADADEKVRGYDFGRGAYYASLLVRGIPGAWDLWKACNGPGGAQSAQALERLEREFQGAVRLLSTLRESRSAEKT